MPLPEELKADYTPPNMGLCGVYNIRINMKCSFIYRDPDRGFAACPVALKLPADEIQTKL